MSAIWQSSAIGRWARAKNRQSGDAVHTLILTGTLVLVLGMWTAGIGRLLYGSRQTLLGFAVLFSGTLVIGVVGATIGLRWGRERRVALNAAATSRDQLSQASALMRAVIDTSPVATLAFDRNKNITFWSAAAEGLFGWRAEEVLGHPMPTGSVAEFSSSDHGIGRILAGDVVRAQRTTGRSRGGRELLLEIYGAPLLRDGVLDGYAGQAIDLTDGEHSRLQLERLGAAVDQTIDGVVIADHKGVIVYVNPAYEKQSGYAAVDLIGGHYTDILGGILGVDILKPMAGAAGEPMPWFGEMEQRRGDGSTALLQVSITNLHEPSGPINGFVAVQRDVTYMRSIEGDLALEAGVRGVLSGAVHLIPAKSSLEEAGKAICDGLCSIEGIDFASVEVFYGPEDAALLAVSAPEGFQLAAGDHLPAAFSQHLFSSAVKGPWGEYWDSAPEDAEMGAELDRNELRAFAFAPIVHGGRVVGGVGIGTRDRTFARILVERFPLLVDFSTAPSALLAERLHGHLAAAEMRTALAAMIECQAFHPVFQPIVELASGEVVGYEALTRFDSGQRPDLAFADAHAAGLGVELELATLKAAIAASHGLPPGPWLDVNVSPKLLENTEALRECIATAERQLVLEVTEHQQVKDYPALRDAVRSMGAEVRLAVDDVGAGIANFAHIIELGADLVKLDISLVRGVESSPGRQALVLAMRHFAGTAGCRLVAEGVETEAEALALGKFGVEFGQGYWFGRPQALESP